MNNFLEYQEKFLEYLKIQRNYSDETIKGYNEDLNFLRDYYKKNNLNYLKIKYKDIRNFYNYLEQYNYSKSTVSRKISSIRSFYKYLALNNKIESNPFSLATLPKKDKLLPKFLYYNELEEMFDVCDNTPLGQRNRVILEILYATGIRVSELVNIKVKDIDFTNMEIRVLGKGNKERIVYFGDYAKTYLEKYLNDGRKKLLDEKVNDYLFINNKKQRLTTRGVEGIIKKIIKETSIKTNITPHSIRHTFATHLLNEGCDILTVQELLGHESLKATQVYTHITSDELKNIYLKSHPRNRK